MSKNPGRQLHNTSVMLEMKQYELLKHVVSEQLCEILVVEMATEFVSEALTVTSR